MPLGDKLVTSDELMDAVLDGYRQIAPLMRFLTRSIGLTF